MSGWKTMNCRPSLIIILMILFSPLVQAQTQEDDDRPPLDLLEFLGEWETSDGEWLDPAKLEDDDFAKLMSLTDDEEDE